MLRYALRQLAYLPMVLLGASLLIFLLLRALPGDPAALLAGEWATEEQVVRVRQQLHLDEPLYVQYVAWLGDLLRGNLGRSFRNGELVSTEVAARLPATVELAVPALVLGVAAGLVLGLLAATFRGTWWDNGVMVLSLAGIAVPVFWMGLMLIMLFSVKLTWLPLGGRFPAEGALTGPTGFLVLDGILAGRPAYAWDAARHLVLPVITLALFPMATVARVTRSSLLEVLQQDYIRTARAKGLARVPVLMRHALRNALIPVVTIVGISIGPLVGGAVLTETVYGWPGLGRYVVAVVIGRDFPAVQALVLFAALLFATANVLVDLSYALIDPRIRFE